MNFFATQTGPRSVKVVIQNGNLPRFPGYLKAYKMHKKCVKFLLSKIKYSVYTYKTTRKKPVLNFLQYQRCFNHSAEIASNFNMSAHAPKIKVSYVFKAIAGKTRLVDLYLQGLSRVTDLYTHSSSIINSLIKTFKASLYSSEKHFIFNNVLLMNRWLALKVFIIDKETSGLVIIKNKSLVP